MRGCFFVKVKAAERGSSYDGCHVETFLSSEQVASKETYLSVMCRNIFLSSLAKYGRGEEGGG